MKVCIADTLKDPADWRAVDSADWINQPSRPLPDLVGGLDNERGYIHRLCVQGIILTGDHHAVKHLIDGCEVTSWSDDPEDDQNHPDWLPSDPPEWWYRAHVIRFRELAPDENLGGAINTNTTRVQYAGKRALEEWLKASPQGYDRMLLKPWEEFVPPALNLTRHGIWVADELQTRHEDILSLSNWRAWGEHLDPSELDENGLLRPQHEQGRMSPPQGTITYFLRDIDQATFHTSVTNENEMNDTAGTGQTEASRNFSAGASSLEFVWTTLADNPNVVDWPLGLYECQTDCSAIGADMSYGLTSAGAVLGHFGSVDAALTDDNFLWVQTQALFTAAGLNLGSQTVNLVAGLASDRFECLVAGIRASGCHGNQSFTMRYNSDSFGRGPWTAPTGAPIPPLLLSRRPIRTVRV